MHHLAGLGRFEQAIQAASRVIQNEQFAIRHFQSLPGRLLGDSPVLRNITNSQASGTWRKTEACDQAAHGSGEDKENVRFQKARVEALQGEGGLLEWFFWHLIMHPPVLPTGWICLQDAGETHTSQPLLCSWGVGQPQRSLCPEAKLSSRPDGIPGELTHAGQAGTQGRCL